MPLIECQNRRTYYDLSTTQGSYPASVFPPIVRDAVLEVSTIHNVPVELAAQAALGVMSLICQYFINVKCPNFDPAPCSLFLMGVIKSSGGKSLVEQRFFRAVLAFERKQKEDTEAKLPVYRAKLKIWHDDGRRLSKAYREAERDSDEAKSIREERLLHEQDQPVEPMVRELRFAELSPQGLRDTLVANGALGILSPEAGPVVNGMTFSQPAMLSGYWSGEDRPVGLAGGNRRPVEPRLTVSVMLQVAKLSDYMKNRGEDAFETGLPGRFLVVAPECSIQHEQQTPVEDVPEPKLGLFNDRVTQVLSQVIPGPRDRVAVRQSDGASRLWKYFKEANNHELNNGDYSEQIKSFLRKLAQQASRIAALFHYFEGKSGDISLGTMTSAITLCEWYAHEYVRIFTPYSPSPQQKNSEASQKLLDWLQTVAANPWRYPKLTPGRYTERDLSNYSAIRGDPAVLAKSIDLIYGQGFISIEYGKKNGRIVCYPPTPMFPIPQGNCQAQQGSSFPGLWSNPHLYAGTINSGAAMPAQPSFNSTVEGKQMAGLQLQVENLKQGVNDRADVQAVKQELQELAMAAFKGRS